ncbi:MAG TPA: serine protease [Allosphingosinicella sp.]
MATQPFWGWIRRIALSWVILPGALALFAAALPAIARVAPTAAAAAPTPKQKDFWDKLDAASGIVSGLLVAAIGFWATNLYNRRQKEAEERRKDQEIIVSQIQTVEKFLPHLAGTDEQIKSASLVAISALGNSELAVKLSRLFGGPGGTSALTQIAATLTSPGAASAHQSLLSILAPLQTRVVTLTSDKGRLTAFIVSARGWIATVTHVVDPDGPPARRYWVTWPGGESLPADLLKVDRNRQLVLFKVDAPQPLEAVEIETRTPAIGESVTALQIRMDGKPTLAFGKVVTHGSREYPAATIGVDLAGFPGASGSPVVNREGRLLGVMHSRDASGLRRYLIPSTELFAFVEEVEAELQLAE